MGRATRGSNRKKSDRTKSGRKKSRRESTRRKRGGVFRRPGRGGPAKESPGARHRREEAERRARLEQSLQAAAVVVEQAAAAATPAADLALVQNLDLHGQLAAAADGEQQPVATAMAALGAMARLNDRLTTEIQTALEAVRTRGDRDTAIAAARRIAPLARAVLSVAGPIPVAPAVDAVGPLDRRRWREIAPALANIGDNQGLGRDRTTGRWRERYDGEYSAYPVIGRPNLDVAVTLLEGLVRDPPQHVFSNWTGFQPSNGAPPPPPGQFRFGPPPPQTGGFNC